MFIPKLEHSRVETHAGDAAIGGSTIYYKPLANPGAANTKGAWTELYAAVPFDVAALLISAQIPSNAFTFSDIAIGPAGSEVVVFPNLLFTLSSTASANSNHSVVVPLAIPKGTRVAMRFQHQSGGTPLFRVKASILAAGLIAPRPPQVWEGWGQNTATTRGVQLLTGASNVKGAWTQLVAATAFDVRWVLFGTQTIESPRHVAVDVGVGGAGSEVVVLPDVLNHSEEQNGVLFGPFPFTIPKGTRIAARAASTNAGSAPLVSAWGGGRG